MLSDEIKCENIRVLLVLSSIRAQTTPFVPCRSACLIKEAIYKGGNPISGLGCSQTAPWRWTSAIRITFYSLIGSRGKRLSELNLRVPGLETCLPASWEMPHGRWAASVFSHLI
jgi:hypothetical protein